jgi:hypothetical protein
MQPQDEPPEKKPKETKRLFPPGLEFLSEISHPPPMEPEEKVPWARALLKKLAENRQLMREHGMDADRMIRELEPLVEGLEKSQREVEESQERLLHTAADLGDSMRKFVDGIEELVQYASDERPFDPEVQEWKEQVEEMRKQYPKID